MNPPTATPATGELQSDARSTAGKTALVRDAQLDRSRGAQGVGERSTAEQSSPATSRPDANRGESAAARYRFNHLTIGMILRDLSFRASDPAPGDRLPDIELRSLDGTRFQPADLARNGPILLVFGSSTCPVTDSAAPGLNALHNRFGQQVQFLLVNVREAHPGAAIPQPASMPDKLRHAMGLRDLHRVAFPVATDDLDGTFHRAMSPKPNSAYIIGSDGTILFRALWANDTRALAAALAAVANGRRPQPAESGGLIRSPLAMMPNIAPVLDRAGTGAWREMARAAPPLALVAFVLKQLRIRPAPPA